MFAEAETIELSKDFNFTIRKESPQEGIYKLQPTHFRSLVFLRFIVLN